MQLYTISIPAKPHIARFATIRYGNPVFIQSKTTLGILINALLNTSSYRSKFVSRDIDLRLKYLKSEIPCAAALSDMVRGKTFGLSPDHIIGINQFLENQFRPRFMQKDIMNIENFNFYIKLI